MNSALLNHRGLNSQPEHDEEYPANYYAINPKPAESKFIQHGEKSPDGDHRHHKSNDISEDQQYCLMTVDADSFLVKIIEFFSRGREHGWHSQEERELRRRAPVKVLSQAADDGGC